MATPGVDQISASALRKLKEKTVQDQVLYDVAMTRWNALVAAEGRSFQEELGVFRGVQHELNQTCHHHSRHPACIWYKLDDGQLLELVKNSTTEAIPFEF